MVRGIELTTALALAIVVDARSALAQAPPPTEAGAPPAVVQPAAEPHEEGTAYTFGIGGAFGVDLGAPRFNPGGIAFFEFEAIPRWLSIEAAVTFVKTANGAEFSSAILFEKPFRLRRNVELVVGLGPEAVQTVGSTPSATYLAIQGLLELKLWPTERFGFWVAPTYDLVLRNPASLSIGASLGPMVTWR